MRIARILYPVEVLGPGKRIGIWVCGCRRRCPDCANPELWALDEKRQIDMETLFSMLAAIWQKHPVDGVTISGGEPFLQTEELDQLVAFLRRETDDILLFTGYRKATLQKRKRLREPTRRILETVAVLVDGPYIREQNNGHPLRGSQNQHISYRDAQIQKKYETYLSEQEGTHRVQNFLTHDGMIAVGIHPRKFQQQFIR
jgi:anaerobic ribonucleoside-triphosphate reductase activating protein